NKKKKKKYSDEQKTVEDSISNNTNQDDEEDSEIDLNGDLGDYDNEDDDNEYEESDEDGHANDGRQFLDVEADNAQESDSIYEESTDLDNDLDITKDTIEDIRDTFSSLKKFPAGTKRIPKK
ncbi:MAG: hypothetical protein MHPSP_004412, partial [Paramarteilia canceri]